VPGRSAGSAVREVEDALATPPRPEAAAFFDVDNTIVVGASIFHFARGLAARNYFSTSDLRRFLWQQVKFRAGGEGPDNIARARESALAFIAGKPVADIVATSEEIYDETIASGIYPEPGRWPSCTSTRASGSGWSPRRRRSWPTSSRAGWG